MIRYSILMMIFFLFFNCSNEYKSSTKNNDQTTDVKSSPLNSRFYDGIELDKQDIRDTDLFPNNVKYSSSKAMQAAYRIFTKVEFVGMSKAEILDLLGDPVGSSDYDIKMQNTKDSPLIYRFDSGLGGHEWQIQFKDNIATKVIKVSLN